VILEKEGAVTEYEGQYAFYSPYRLPTHPDNRDQAKLYGPYDSSMSHGVPSFAVTANRGAGKQILRDGDLVIGRRFDLGRLAEKWAAE